MFLTHYFGESEFITGVKYGRENKFFTNNVSEKEGTTLSDASAFSAPYFMNAFNEQHVVHNSLLVDLFNGFFVMVVKEEPDLSEVTFDGSASVIPHHENLMKLVEPIKVIGSESVLA